MRWFVNEKWIKRLIEMKKWHYYMTSRIFSFWYTLYMLKDSQLADLSIGVKNFWFGWVVRKLWPKICSFLWFLPKFWIMTYIKKICFFFFLITFDLIVILTWNSAIIYNFIFSTRKIFFEAWRNTFVLLILNICIKINFLSFHTLGPW